MKIDIADVSAWFAGSVGAVNALDHVSLEVDEGEFVVIVGPSGCGKTTLLMAVAGLVTPTSGRILVDSKEVRAPDPDRGVIFQQYALFPWLNVKDNVEFGLRVKGIGRAERERISGHFLDLVGLTDFTKALPKELSGGMKQRCAIARAYAASPSILLMDEPFGALDALTRTELQAQLLEVWDQERRTVLFITHDVDEAVFLGSRVVVMTPRPGRIREIIEVGLPYPRTPEARLTDEFTEIRNKVWQSVQTEIHSDGFGIANQRDGFDPSLQRGKRR